MTFLPVEKHARLQCEGVVERIVREEGLSVLGWRDMPVYASATGRVARASQPYMQQIFVGCHPGLDEDALERKLYVVRKLAEDEMRKSEIEDAGMFYIPSLSCRTVVYKGLLLASQLYKLLPRAFRPGCGQRSLPGASTVLYEYVSQLAARASLSVCGA